MLISKLFVFQNVTVFRDWAFEEGIMQDEVTRVSLIQFTLPGKVLRTHTPMEEGQSKTAVSQGGPLR